MFWILSLSASRAITDQRRKCVDFLRLYGRYLEASQKGVWYAIVVIVSKRCGRLYFTRHEIWDPNVLTILGSAFT